MMTIRNPCSQPVHRIGSGHDERLRAEPDGTRSVHARAARGCRSGRVAVVSVGGLWALDPNILAGWPRRLDRSVLYQLPARALVLRDYHLQRSVFSSDVLPGAEDARLLARAASVCPLLPADKVVFPSIPSLLTRPVRHHRDGNPLPLRDLPPLLKLSFLESLLLTVYFFTSRNVINLTIGVWSQRASVFLMPAILL